MTELYITGAIASDPNFVEKFAAAARELQTAGYLTLNPVDIQPCLSNSVCGGKGALHTWECYMKHDVAEMVHCDGVAQLDDWVQSPGARAECAIAALLTIPVLPIQVWIERKYET